MGPTTSGQTLVAEKAPGIAPGDSRSRRARTSWIRRRTRPPRGCLRPGDRAGSAGGGLVTAEGRRWRGESETQGHARAGSPVLGPIAEVRATREGRLVVRRHIGPFPIR
jgi:hypothetical protein